MSLRSKVGDIQNWTLRPGPGGMGRWTHPATIYDIEQTPFGWYSLTRGCDELTGKYATAALAAEAAGFLTGQ